MGQCRVGPCFFIQYNAIRKTVLSTHGLLTAVRAAVCGWVGFLLELWNVPCGWVVFTKYCP